MKDHVPPGMLEETAHAQTGFEAHGITEQPGEMLKYRDTHRTEGDQMLNWEGRERQELSRRQKAPCMGRCYSAPSQQRCQLPNPGTRKHLGYLVKGNEACRWN